MIYKSIGGVPVQYDPKDPETLFWFSHLEIDADGSPRCYAPHGSGLTALDILADAGIPGEGYGVARDKNKKFYIQGKNDPYPGYYVSTTSLIDVSKSEDDTTRYVDSENVPFFVLPSTPTVAARLGQIAMFFRPATGDSSAAVYADVGPRNQIGEGSILLAKNLGATPKELSAISGGLENIVTVLFRASAHNWPRTNLNVLEEANRLFTKWGGFSELRASFPHLDWSKF